MKENKYSPLLKLAREAIATSLNNKNLIISPELKEKFSEKLACFVTLTINQELRGCIGSLLPRQELWKDIIENARNAAFSDPRFPELTLEELKKIKIEISILTLPKKITYNNEGELKQKIHKKGVILKKGFYQSTYLPQVWQEIKNENDFLSSLCSKAGLPSNAWKNLNLEISTYEASSVEE